MQSRGVMTHRYTDGTFTAEGTLEQWATGQEQTIAAAGVYVSGSEEKRYRLADGIALDTAHAAETLALAIGMRGARGHAIHSDCAAAIAAWSGRRKYRGIKQVNRLAGEGFGDVCKVKAHAERTKPREEWTKEEEGNVIADAVAAGREEDAGGEVTNVPADTLRDLLSDVSPFLWIDKNDRVTYEVKKTRRMPKYLRERDQSRAAATPARAPRWEGTTCHLASSMWKQEGKASSWARAVRIMWDKHLTGENETKWNMAVTHTCELCGVPTNQTHLLTERRRPGMDKVRTEARNKVQNEADK